MPQVKPVKLPNGNVVLMEVDETIQMPDLSSFSQIDDDDDGLGGKSWNDNAAEAIQDLAGTVKALATSIPDAFKDAAGANVEKITLTFGVKLGGEAGIPFVTKGSMEGNIEIEVECTFPK